jgi:hypothetical protein
VAEELLPLDMKRTFLLVLIGMTLGCTDEKIRQIEGCSYIETTSFTGEGPVVSKTHMGNCPNPIHGQNVQKQDLKQDTTNLKPLKWKK